MNRVLHTFLTIQRRGTRIALAGILCLYAAACGRDPAPAPTAKTIQPGPKPNVIWILLDALRAQNLSAYGYERTTSPNMDRLAAQGVLFEQQFSHSSRTATSVPSYMTGRHFPLHCLGWRFSGATLAREPAEGEMLFPRVMKANGYQTAMFTAHPLFRPTDRLWKAFDEVMQWRQGTRCILQRFEKINEKLFPWLEAHTEKPFFIYIHAVDTHFPHEIIAPFDQWIDPAYNTDQLVEKYHGQGFARRDSQPFTAADKEYFCALYDGGILDADTQVGRLLNKLEELRLMENTFVFITADHGQILGEDGESVKHGTSADEDLHVPFILAGPGLPAGKRVEVLTENTDIVPTLTEVLHLKTDAKYDGVSLVPWIEGTRTRPPHDYTFAVPYNNWGLYESPVSFVLRTPSHKYEYHLANGTANLWKVPDTIAARIDLINQQPRKASALEKKMLAKRMPLWKTYLDLPVRAVVVEAAFISSVASPPDAVVDTYILSRKGEPEDLWKDNKWAYTEGRFWCRGAQEQCPPLTVSVEAPNGRYALHMGILNNSDLHGDPASAFRVKVNGETEARLIVADDLPPEKACFQMINLGRYDITDGHLDITFEQADRQHWASMNAIVLLPIVSGQSVEPTTAPWFDPESPDNRSETEEVMKALGYL